MTDENTQKDAAVESEETIKTDDNGQIDFTGVMLENIKPEQLDLAVTQHLRERVGLPTKFEKETKAEEKVEPETGEEVKDEDDVSHETLPAKDDDIVFTLKDGTKVTRKEAEAGYVRTQDWHRKNQSVAEEKRKLGTYKSIVEYFESNPDEVDFFIERVRGKTKGEGASASQVKKLKVPEQYANDPFLSELVGVVNTVLDENANLKSAVNNVKTASTKNDASTQINAKLNEAYTWLGQEMGNKSPTTQQFIERFQTYLADKQLSPDDIVPYILGPDSDYLKDLVHRIYQGDIERIRKDMDADKAKQKKVNPEKKAILTSSGKSNMAGSAFTVPKTADGKVDSAALARQDPRYKNIVGVAE